ncbi:unnamed protein product [Rodentolepis nana]|uniref:GOLD domain-containing protein n=1 Tax=Rodentolepis nana TaxID=102285 RepID=A0A0R3TKJ7_RODNA|nr:unnamed protein product [Rodentolepis nana]
MKIFIGVVTAFLFSLLTILVECFPKQFTFELPGTEEMCFYEKLDKSEHYNFMFQVLKGASSDIQLVIRDPSKNALITKSKTNHESVDFIPQVGGDYAFCFSNQYSPMSPNQILIELRGQDTLREEAGFGGSGPMSAIETLAESIHEHLSVSESYQTELRAKLTSDRIFAFELRSHITIWSCAVSLIIILTVLSQIAVLKSFFKDSERYYTALNSH